MENTDTQNAQAPQPVNTEEIRPIGRPNKTKVLRFAIPLAGMVALLGGVLLISGAVQNQQDNRSRASFANLLSNPGCELGTTYFKGYQSAISVDTNIKRSGNASCRIYSLGGSFYDMETQQLVANPQPGQTYTAAAYVRAPSATNGKVAIALREQGGSAATRTVTGTPVYLSTQWQLVTATITIQNSGRTSLLFYVLQDPGAMGQSFNADDMVFAVGTSLAQPSNTPIPTIPPTLTPAPQPVSLTVDKTSAAPGEQITATWANIPNPTAQDVIGLYTTTAANTDRLGWMYVSCSQTATIAKASGSCTFPLPSTPLSASTLELRLLSNNSTTVMAKSAPFSYLAPTATPTIIPTNVPTATAIPTTAITLTPTTTPVALTPTETPAPGSTIAKIDLLLHGVGKGGDSANPNALGNSNPARQQRTISVDLYNSQNQLVLSKQAVAVFDSTTGSFKANANLGTDFSTGVYTVRVKTDQYLRGLVSGIQTITKGQTTTLSNLALIAGDVNNDNQINIIDYNLVTGCYSDLLPAVSCTSTNKILTDFNDDGKTNQFDYNLFLRELTNISGQ